MTPYIGEAFHLSNSKLGLLAWANLFVFAVASLISGPDRRPGRPAQGDLRGHLRLVDRHHRLGAVDLVPDAAVLSRAGRGGRRRLRAVGQHAPLRRRAARKARAGPRDLQRRHGAGRNEWPGARGDAGAPLRLARRLLDCRWSVDPARALRRVSLRPRPPGATEGGAGPLLPALADLPAGARRRHPGHLRRQLADLLDSDAGHRRAPFQRHRRERLHGRGRPHRRSGRRHRRGLRRRRLQPAPERRPRADHRRSRC